MKDLKLKPTETELSILQILWKRGNGTVRQVHEELSLFKESGYTTTLKLMQIMHEKGILSRDDSSKVHVYTPVISREKTRKQFIGKMAETLFGGSTPALAMEALGQSRPSAEELDQIQQLIDQLKETN